jgi:hypothetical protein
MSYYNIALAHERMGNAKEAIIHLEQKDSEIGTLPGFR